MRLLFDQNLSRKLCRHLDDLWPGSVHVGELGLADADDEAVWDYARQHGFTLVTQDVDFANLSLLRGSPPKVIWLRCGNQATSFIEVLLRKHHSALLQFQASTTSHFAEVFR